MMSKLKLERKLGIIRKTLATLRALKTTIIDLEFEFDDDRKIERFVQEMSALIYDFQDTLKIKEKVFIDEATNK